MFTFQHPPSTEPEVETSNPVTIRDKEFGAVRIRAFGIYSYKIFDPRAFHFRVNGTREEFSVLDLDGTVAKYDYCFRCQTCSASRVLLAWIWLPTITNSGIS
jgi:hypothetical protein